ncbi:MAG: HAD family hydrolase [Nitrospiria bacterium]
MTSVKLLIFDLDGTLIDSKRDIAKSVNKTFRDIGLPEKPQEVIYGFVGNGVRQLIVDAVASEDPQLINRSLKIFEQHYLAHLLDETRLFPGIASVLYHYESKKKALVTNKPAKYTDKIIMGLGVKTLFDSVIAGDPTIELKPHPEMILKTLEAVKTEPSDAVMIGDSLNDIHAARSAGVRICGVGYGFGDTEVLKSAGLDYFVETGQDLITLFS